MLSFIFIFDEIWNDSSLVHPLIASNPAFEIEVEFIREIVLILNKMCHNEYKYESYLSSSVD